MRPAVKLAIFEGHRRNGFEAEKDIEVATNGTVKHDFAPIRFSPSICKHFLFASANRQVLLARRVHTGRLLANRAAGHQCGQQEGRGDHPHRRSLASVGQVLLCCRLFGLPEQETLHALYAEVAQHFQLFMALHPFGDDFTAPGVHDLHEVLEGSIIITLFGNTPHH